MSAAPILHKNLKYLIALYCICLHCSPFQLKASCPPEGSDLPLSLSTEKAEIDFFHKYLEGDDEGLTWAELVRMELSSPINTMEHLLSQGDLVKKILEIPTRVMIPQTDNFTPPNRTPWGGYEIVRHYKKDLGVTTSDIVGESWEISGHRSFPNSFELDYHGENLSIPVTLLEMWVPQLLYGGSGGHQTMPFIVKLLNSGSWKKLLEDLQKLFIDNRGTSFSKVCEKKLNVNSLSDMLNSDYHTIHQNLCLLSKCLSNVPSRESQTFLRKVQDIHQKMIEKNLSIQVHPNKGDYSDKPSKTEAWIILSAEEGAGIYLGLKEGISEQKFQKGMIGGEDLSNFLNFVTPKPGDVFLIPTGTLHAIGAGILLVEPQETSESTFRAYDWGRLTNGKPRQLHYEETIKVTDWNAPRGNKSIENLSQKGIFSERTNSGAIITSLINIEEFQFNKIGFPEKNTTYKSDLSRFEAFFVSSGSVEVVSMGHSTHFKKGQSFIIPYHLSGYAMINQESNTELFQTTVSPSP